MHQLWSGYTKQTGIAGVLDVNGRTHTVCRNRLVGQLHLLALI